MEAPGVSCERPIDSFSMLSISAWRRRRRRNLPYDLPYEIRGGGLWCTPAETHTMHGQRKKRMAALRSHVARALRRNDANT